MKAIRTLLAVFLLLGTLALNAGFVLAEESNYDNGKPTVFHPGDDL